jgi:hypothetical protein
MDGVKNIYSLNGMITDTDIQFLNKNEQMQDTRIVL